MKKKLGLAVLFTALAALVLPGAASAASLSEVTDASPKRPRS